MMKRLYIFATSDRPDVYINGIAYSIEHLDVGSVYVIVVSEHDYPEEAQQAQLKATKVVGNISNQLEALQRGKYLSTTRGGNPKESDLTDTDGIAVYKKCLEVINRSGTTGIAIPHGNLEATLRTYLRRGSCVVDVSALKKNLLVDVVSVLLSYGFSDVYSFELKVEPSFGQDDLYHRLRFGESFEYRNLATSQPVRSSLRRISRWAARSRAILVFTTVLAATFIPISILWNDSYLWTVFNVAAMIASIASYLSIFVTERQN